MTACLAGAAAIDITPTTPQWLDGYGNRTEPSHGAYQSISAKALALTAGGGDAVIVSAEILGFDRSRTAELKQRISAATGTTPSAVILTATHTHCAPRVCDMVMPGEVDPDYVEFFEAACITVAQRAVAARQPADVQFSRAQDCSLGINRRFPADGKAISRPNPEGSHDRDLDTLWFVGPDGARIASLTIAACHPTCRGGQQIGGDYPGFLTRELERAGGVALFVLGCAGDVRPNFTHTGGGFRMAELDEVEAAGKELARAIEAAAVAAEPAECRRISVDRILEEIDLAEPPDVGTLEEISRSDSNGLRQRWADRMLSAASLPRTVGFEVQLLCIEPGAVMIFWPGEVVADYALWFKSLEVPDGPRLLAGAYANGTVGYVPSREIYPLGGYEVNGSHFYYSLPAAYSPSVEDQLREISVRLMQGRC